MASSDRKVRIAILGGGLAGATAFRGLSKISNLQVDIFESAPTFREQGQAVGLNHDAVCALDLLGLKECLSVAGAVQNQSMRCMIGQGPDTGKMSFDLNLREKGTRTVYRPTFLAELLKNADTKSMHAGKKLKHLEQGDEVNLFFEDGSTFTCDILIGADGIHSTIRKYIIGKDHPAASPHFAGWWTVWMVVPFEKAQHQLGKEFMDEDSPRQFLWCGKDTWTMHDGLSDNTLSQCVMVMRVPEDSVTNPRDFVRSISKEELRQKFKGWHPRFETGMIDLVTESGDDVPIYSLWHHKPDAPTYVKDNIAIVGDAADATTPWQGSGSGFAMEDAYILSELFATVQTISDAKAALKAYDHVRRPRRQRLIQSSYEVGMVFTGCVPEVGIDPNKIYERLKHQWDWIFDVDLEQHRDEAIQAMHQFRE